jgi:hypothetical protein
VSANRQGIKPLADYVHSKGLKFGMQIMRGIPRRAVDADMEERQGDPHDSSRDGGRAVAAALKPAADGSVEVRLTKGGLYRVIFA